MTDPSPQAPSEPDLAGDPDWRSTILPTDVGIVSFVSGEPAGQRLRVRYFRDGEGRLKARVWFGPGTQGPPGHAHGGSIAAILDEAMGGAAWMSGAPAVALELTCRFRNMVPLEVVATLTAEVVGTEGRKIRTCGRLEGPDGTLYAEGEALFLTLDAGRLGSLMEKAKGMLGDDLDFAAPAPVDAR